MHFKAYTRDGKRYYYDLDIVPGNCLCVVLYQTKKQYDFISFYSSLQHLKNCLGLTPKYKQYGDIVRDLMLNSRLISITFNSDVPSYKPLKWINEVKDNE